MPRDPIELAVFKHLFHAIAEEMGATLRRTAFSPNIKERRDYSCAMFDCRGNVLAMGDHMPVHLGSMPMSVRAAIDELTLVPGDIAMLNDPFRGGTHLPDITVIAPVFIAAQKSRNLAAQHSRNLTISTSRRIAAPDSGTRDRRHAPDFFVAARAHHADIGGAFAGSMGPSREIYQEGLRIPPVKIARAGEVDRDVLQLLLNNVRTPAEREGDLRAQLAACHTGISRLHELCERYGLARVQRAGHALLGYSEHMMRAFLAAVPSGAYSAEDFLDDNGVDNDPANAFPQNHAANDLAPGADLPPAAGSASHNMGANACGVSVPSRTVGALPRTIAQSLPSSVTTYHNVGQDIDRRIRLAVRITFPSRISGQQPVIVDFTGSSPQVEGSINAVEAITWSACFYVFRCLLRDEIPATAGLMRPISVIAPAGTVVNARPPAAVAGGNVETSQRIVDVLLRALAQALPDRIPAASSGTMNNLTIGGIDDRRPTLSPKPAERMGHPTTGNLQLRTAPSPFAYYETIAGGSGAGPTHGGVSGVHTHMTNSLNTPAEALEYSYPFRVTKYALRTGSGGDGQHRGGDGIVREIEVLTDATVTLLADRRETRPYGLAGGADGAPGRTEILRTNGSVEILPSKTSARLRRGDRIRIETPGGGGWGPPTPDADRPS